MNVNQFFVLCPIHPLVYITIAMMLGITAKYYFTWHFFLVFPLIALLSVYYLQKNSRTSQLIIMCLFALFGGAWRYSHQINHYNNFIDLIDGSVCDIKGRI